MSFNFAGILLVVFFVVSACLRRFIGLKYSMIILLILAILSASYLGVWSTLLNLGNEIAGKRSYSDSLYGNSAFFIALFFEILGITLGQIVGKIWHKNSR